MCFIAAAYFPLQVLVLVFVKVITLPLKMLYRVCCKTLYSYWSWLEHSHLLGLWKYRVLGCYAAVRTKVCLPNAR